MRTSGRPHKEKEDKGADSANAIPKKLVTGTNADLRKLPLKDAKAMLREFRVPESEVMCIMHDFQFDF